MKTTILLFRAWIFLFAAGCFWSTAGRAQCFREAATRYQVSEALLRAIAKTENSRADPTLVVRDKYGWEYVGLMMVSTIHLRDLAPYGITRAQLLDACTNVNIGAWVLARAISRFGSTWKAVGAYNTGEFSDDAAAQERYIVKVWKNLGK